MTEVLAGLTLGVAGSLHCVAMCGPLVATLHGAGWPSGQPNRRGAGWLVMILHHTARVATYGTAGVVAGLAGGAIATGTGARALSVLAGVALCAMAIGRLPMEPAGLAPRVGRLASGALARVARRPIPPQQLAVSTGILHAVLPCGMVYAALASAAAWGYPVASGAFMVAFGIGTTPPPGRDRGVSWVASTVGRHTPTARAIGRLGARRCRAGMEGPGRRRRPSRSPARSPRGARFRRAA